MLSVSEVWSRPMHSCNQSVDWVETDIKQYNKYELLVWIVAQQLHAGTSIKQWLFISQANHTGVIALLNWFIPSVYLTVLL